MAVGSMHFAYYLFLLTFCIDKGDGRWKKSDKENLRRDIKLYRKITERVEHELQEYYAEYEDHGSLRFNFNRNYYETNRNIPKINNENGREKIGQKKREKTPIISKFTQITNDIPIYNKTAFDDTTSSNEISVNRNKVPNKNSRWPKFEDILLAIGKKYDWKNDRWIKVKEKFKIKNIDYDKLDNSNNMFHEKHRFSYRTIKLNRGKNKRNVVIAVTAIR